MTGSWMASKCPPSRRQYHGIRRQKMGDFKLKIAIGNAQIELEGEGELVHTIFQELRETGLGNISPLVKAEKQIQGDKPDNQNDSDELPHKPMETSPQYDSTLDFELPSLNNVVMQGLPQKESEWLLIYALYASNCGSQFFTKEDLRAKYAESNRVTTSHNNHFADNIKILVSAKYISAINATDFRLEQSGLEKAKDILSGSIVGKKASKTKGSTLKRVPSTYEFLELGLTEEERAEIKTFWNQHNHSSNISKAVLAAYWLKKNKNVADFTSNHLFTMLRTVEESTSFDLFSAIANAKRSKNYFVNGSTPRSYTITHIGEDYVKKLEISQREDK